MADIYAPEFTNEAAAIAHLEKSRWEVSGANCPHCGSFAVRKMEGTTQAGYWLCNDCRDKFTCRTGTVMERSHIPVHKWLLAIHLFGRLAAPTMWFMIAEGYRYTRNFKKYLARLFIFAVLAILGLASVPKK